MHKVFSSALCFLKHKNSATLTWQKVKSFVQNTALLFKPFTSSILSCYNSFFLLIFHHLFHKSTPLSFFPPWPILSLPPLLSLCPPMSSSPLLQPHLSTVTCSFAVGFLCSPCCYWLAPAVKIQTHPMRQEHCPVGGAMKQPIAWSIKTTDCELMIVDRGEQSIVGQTASSE